MQISKFTSGGFVAHKIHLDGYASTFSAWVGPCENLRDAYRVDASGRAFPVAKGSRAWARLDGRMQSVARHV